jgi:hypothetical protein
MDVQDEISLDSSTNISIGVTPPKNQAHALLFIACGAWEAIYILDALIRNRSTIKPTAIHADIRWNQTPGFFREFFAIPLLFRRRMAEVFEENKPTNLQVQQWAEEMLTEPTWSRSGHT